MRSIRPLSVLVVTALLVPSLAAARPSLRTVEQAGIANKTSAQNQRRQNQQQGLSSAQSASGIPLARYSHAKLGVATQVPTSWKVGEADYLFTDPKEGLVGMFSVSFSDPVSKELVPSVFTIDFAPQATALAVQNLDSYISGLWNYDVHAQKVIDPDKPVRAGMSAITVSAAKVGGYDGKTYNYTTSSFGERRTVSITLIPVDTYLYTFTSSLSDDHLEKGLAAYATMLSSVSFSKPVLSMKSSSSKSSKAAGRIKRSSSRSASSRPTRSSMKSNSKNHHQPPLEDWLNNSGK
jgi:hypothetical protein